MQAQGCSVTEPSMISLVDFYFHIILSKHRDTQEREMHGQTLQLRPVGVLTQFLHCVSRRRIAWLFIALKLDWFDIRES